MHSDSSRSFVRSASFATRRRLKPGTLCFANLCRSNDGTLDIASLLRFKDGARRVSYEFRRIVVRVFACT